jgi:hypothetical protein
MDIKQGYDVPEDLEFEPKPWFGLTTRHGLILLISAIAVIKWYELIVSMGFTWESMVFRIPIIIYVPLIAVIVFGKLDIKAYRMARWAITPYVADRHNRIAKDLSGTVSIADGWYLNKEGNVCVALSMTALNSDRVNDADVDTRIDMDKHFLNALPCKIQIVRYTFAYNTSDYIDAMLHNARAMPEKHQKYLVAHLNDYKKRCEDENVQEPMYFMILSIDAQTHDAVKVIGDHAAVITKNLMRSGVISERLQKSDLATMLMMVTTGIGRKGIDYLSDAVEVKNE